MAQEAACEEKIPRRSPCSKPRGPWTTACRFPGRRPPSHRRPWLFDPVRREVLAPSNEAVPPTDLRGFPLPHCARWVATASRISNLRVTVITALLLERGEVYVECEGGPFRMGRERNRGPARRPSRILYARAPRRLRGIVLVALAVLAWAPAARGVPVGHVSPWRFPIEVAGVGLEIPYERSHPLDVSSPAIVRVVIVIHGSRRDSDAYLADVMAAAQAAGKAQQTLVIAPQFLEEEDVVAWSLPPTLPFWDDGWREGDRSRSTVANPRPARVSSFAVVDAIVDVVATPGVFPNLRSIVITGHSAGGQFVNRFAAGSAAPDLHPGRSFRYVIANPSSYLYFTPERRVAGVPGAFAVPSAQEIAACPTYDDYRYGLKKLNHYMAAVGPALITTRYRTRTVEYLIGELDTGTDGLSLTCAAMLQGERRLDRGTIYFAYLKHVFGIGVVDEHRLRIVPGVGHDASGIYLSQPGRDALFEPAARVPALGVPGRGLLCLLFLAGGFLAKRARRVAP